MKFKRLIPALAMLLVSAILLGTSTFAWFSMNTEVTATGMQVKAVAEEGIVIAPAAAGTYDVSATSAKSDTANPAQLFPGSTSDLSTWFHSKSTNPAAANTQQEYTTGTAWANNTDKGNYIVHDFYIRSSSATALTVGSVDIKSVTAKVSGAAASNELSKSLRVGVLVAGDTTAYIYAPVAQHDASNTIQPTVGDYTSTGRVTVTPLETNAVSHTTVTSIPANTATGIHVQVFIWYEGEDSHCISNNIIATLENIDVDVVFGYTAA